MRSASASSCMSMKTCRMPEEGLKVHRFAGVLPDQLLTEASRHRDAVVPADKRAVMRCLGDDLAGFVHDVSHSRIASTAPGLPCWPAAARTYRRSIRDQSQDGTSRSHPACGDHGGIGIELLQLRYQLSGAHICSFSAAAMVRRRCSQNLLHIRCTAGTSRSVTKDGPEVACRA